MFVRNPSVLAVIVCFMLVNPMSNQVPCFADMLDELQEHVESIDMANGTLQLSSYSCSAVSCFQIVAICTSCFYLLFFFLFEVRIQFSIVIMI